MDLTADKHQVCLCWWPLPALVLPVDEMSAQPCRMCRTIPTGDGGYLVDSLSHANVALDLRQGLQLASKILELRQAAVCGLHCSAPDQHQPHKPGWTSLPSQSASSWLRAILQQRLLQELVKG